MVSLGSLTINYAARGHHELIRADKRVRDSISVTARHAKRDEATTKGWLQRHKTALLAIAGTIGAAFYSIARESPSMSAALGEIRLAFSLFFMDVGERAAPFFEKLGELAMKLLEMWEGLPEGLKNVLVRGTPAIVEEWDGLLTELAKKVDETFGTGDKFQGISQALIDEWNRFKENPTGWGSDFVVRFKDAAQGEIGPLKEKMAVWGAGLVSSPRVWG